MCAALTRHLLITLMLLLVAVPGLAQTTPEQSTAIAPTAAPSEQDLQALNYYLQQKDQASADAELRRLRTQFPDWVPPADPGKLAVTQPSTEIDTIFRQIASSQLTEARATIAATQTQYATWIPPADMITLLETAEGQARLDAALDAGNASEALQIASTTDGLLRCDRVNNAWRIAKAQEAQQAISAALATYSGIMRACVNFPDIIATLEKSDTVTTDQELAALFAVAQVRFPAKTVELTALQAKLLAGRGEAPADIAIQTGVQPATGTAGGTVPATGTAPATGATRTPSEPQLVLQGPDVPNIRPQNRSNPNPQKAAPATGSNTVTADRSSGSSGAGREMTSAQCLAATQGASSAGSLAQRGWCAYNLDRPLEALSAFQSAESRLGGSQRRDARFGVALSYLKLNMTEQASRIAATTDLTHQQRVETESIILNQRGVQAYKKRQYPKAIAYFDALEQMKGTLPRDLAILRGYAWLNGGSKAKARAIFLTLHNQLATAETLAALKATE